MVIVAVRTGKPTYGLPLTVTVYVPLAPLQDSMEVTEVVVDVRVGWLGCRLHPRGGTPGDGMLSE